MLIDRVDKKILQTRGINTDCLVFYIDESLKEFRSSLRYKKGSVYSDNPLPQKLPYDKFIVHFNDCFVTFNEQDFDSDDAFQAKSDDGSKLYIFFSDSLGLAKDGGLGTILSSDIYVGYSVNDETLQLQSLFTVNRWTKELRQLGDNDLDTMSGGDYLLQYDILYQFLSFLSCKNIEIEEIEPSPKLQRRRAKKKKKPFVTYHILKLKTLTKKYSANGDDGGVWSNRIHLCRGHMREYTDDRPLFGKLVGRYWIPPHARGNRKMGIVQKDYALNT